ncbi:MAG: phosphohistidine phosphatase SixA [Thioalkalispiraceae bacterium]|jgi:phosphohistidine phosphatase
MKLYLMRHGQAASPEVDPEQGLTGQGKAEIEQLARRLAKQGVRFEQVIHSDKKRARQTAEIMASILASGISPRVRSGLKPNDDPCLLLPELESWQQDTLLTSHLPFVPNLLQALTGEPQGMNFAPGSVICLGKHNQQWHIEWIASP